MLSTISIFNAVSKKIEKETGCVVYSNEVLENFKAPCFFLKVSERETEDVGISVMKRIVDVSLNYFPSASEKRVRSELDGNLMAAKLHSIFHLNIQVEDRYIVIRNRRHDFGGENFDILIFSFDLSFFDDFKVQNEVPPIEKVGLNQKLKIN